MCCRVWGFAGSVAEGSGFVGMTLCSWVGRSRRFGGMLEGTVRMTQRHIVTSLKTSTFLTNSNQMTSTIQKTFIITTFLIL